MTDEKQKLLFSSNLSRLIEERNLKQAEIAEYIGVSPQTFNTWVKGIAFPRMGKVQKIADFFNVPKSYLIEEHPDDEPTYYIKPEAAEAAKELYERDELRVLFDAARDVSEEDIRYVATLLEKLKKKEGK
jgi:transcriptional regulator with XRE-family HTH domain|nr:MAG TPA: Repressor protein CI [Caudoviricetes sp.]